MANAKGSKRTPGSGRKKGTPNKVTRVFMAALAEILDEYQTIEKLRELRDSDEAIDRSTFWRLAGKRVPTMIEAKLEGVVQARIIDLSSERRDEDA